MNELPLEGAGKGDTPRYVNKEKFNKNHSNINWNSKRKKKDDKKRNINTPN